MVSVIIPVYNTEKYLRRCVESVLGSIYQDFEVILVNDGSEDTSHVICRMYCEKDCRVRLIDQEHKGVSAARNSGIEASRGEWIVFVDSDDFISADFLGIVAQEKFQDSDLLLFDHQRLKKRKKRAECGNTDTEMSFLYGTKDSVQLIERFLNGAQLSGSGNVNLLSPCAKAYKSSVLKRNFIRFPSDLMIYEDRIFNIEYLLKMRSGVYIQKKVYFIEPRSDSAMRGFNPDFLQNDIRYQEKLRKILRKQFIFRSVKMAYYNSLLSCMADVLIRGIFHPGSNRSMNEKCRLCGEMHRYTIYRQALRYNERSGVIPRRVLLFFFRIGWYGVVRLISEWSYRVLDGMEEL